MGFKALLIREDFFPILSETLRLYFESTGSSSVYVGYEKQNNSREFLLIPEIGMIAEKRPNRIIKKHYYDGYNIRNNLIKNIAAKVYVFGAMHFPTLFALKEQLYISPDDVLSENSIIAVCNRSIRIFDFDNSITVSVQKETFTDFYFNRQLQFRLNNHFSFIPEILDHGEKWFSEKIMQGCMLARLTDKKHYKYCEEKAIEHISELAKSTLQRVDAYNYIGSLLNKNQEMTDRALKEKNISTYSFTKELLKDIKRLNVNTSDSIDTVVSHGDLQAGNIWVDGDEVYIIDWETVDRRSAWFDIATICFETRYYGGIKKLSSAIYDEKTLAILHKNGSSSLNEKWQFLVFVLEDIAFYLEDMLELPGEAGKTSFDNYMNELKELDWEKILENING